MLRAGLTQRVDNVEEYQEMRDGLDRRWYELLADLGALPLPLPNIEPQYVESLISALNLDLIILTGGNSLAGYGNGASYDRDRFEFKLLTVASNYKIRILAVCRGMQCVNIFKGGKIHSVKGHKANRHSISARSSALPIRKTVNSFHEWAIGCDELGADLIPLASDSEGNIEAFTDLTGRVLGLMWHPEREQPFQPLDVELIRWLMTDRLQ